MKPTSGQLIGIARHSKSRAPIEELTSARITSESGVEGDCHGAPGPSQVTVVAEESWRAANLELGKQISWTTRRANLLVRGVNLFHSTGKLLHLGEVVVEITGENEPCFVMDRQCRGLRKALGPGWRAGVACRVIRGGAVRVGDAASLASEDNFE